MVRAPEQWVNYVRVAWSVLITASGISQYVRAARRTIWLISISGTLAGLVVCIRGAAQAPADWVNYIPPALLSLTLLALLLVRRRALTGGQSNAGRAPAQ
jgi:hypothetical protein